MRVRGAWPQATVNTVCAGTRSLAPTGEGGGRGARLALSDSGEPVEADRGPASSAHPPRLASPRLGRARQLEAEALNAARSRSRGGRVCVGVTVRQATCV